MNRRNRILALLIITLLVFIGVYQFMKGNADVQKIKGDTMQTVAQVTQLEVNPKSKLIRLAYAYSVGGSTFFEEADYKPLTEAGDSLLNRYFPIVYFREDPALSRLLITEEDFKTFDIDQPDSLKPHNALIAQP